MRIWRMAANKHSVIAQVLLAAVRAGQEAAAAQALTRAAAAAALGRAVGGLCTARTPVSPIKCMSAVS